MVDDSLGKNADKPEKTHFNEIMCKERVIIERCSGQLKARFPILEYKERLNQAKIPKLLFPV